MRYCFFKPSALVLLIISDTLNSPVALVVLWAMQFLRSLQKLNSGDT